ncbi:MAG: hypothetical protein ACK4QW_16380, partial [Alphaproteobacteria bacterium]
RAREDWLAGQVDFTYCVRDSVRGTIWVVEVTIAMEPSFVALDAREVDTGTHRFAAAAGSSGSGTCAAAFPRGRGWAICPDIAGRRAPDPHGGRRPA